MSITDSQRSAPRASRTWVALAVAGWLAITGLTLPVGVPSDPTESPDLNIQATPVKAYSG